MTSYSAMTVDDDYKVDYEEPYLTRDIGGKYVILQNEILKCLNPTGNGGPLLLYSSEILIDDNPSDEKIFKMKLAGAYVQQRFSIGDLKKIR